MAQVAGCAPNSSCSTSIVGSAGQCSPCGALPQRRRVIPGRHSTSSLQAYHLATDADEHVVQRAEWPAEQPSGEAYREKVRHMHRGGPTSVSRHVTGSERESVNRTARRRKRSLQPHSLLRKALAGVQALLELREQRQSRPNLREGDTRTRTPRRHGCAPNAKLHVRAHTRSNRHGHGRRGRTQICT